jgi:hypothetical protein
MVKKLYNSSTQLSINFIKPSRINTLRLLQPGEASQVLANPDKISSVLIAREIRIADGRGIHAA